MSVARNHEQQLKLDIYSYHDYREFLKDWLANEKASQSGLSMRALARKIEISVSYLTMVLSGERKLNESTFLKLASEMSLDTAEIAYMDQLRVIADSEVHEERLAALKKLQRFSEYKKRNSQEIEVYRYLTKWYYVAIREMAGMREFKTNEKWIQKRMRKKVSLKKIREALEFLIQNGYIRRSSEKAASRAEKHLNCVDGVYKVSLGHFHKQMLELASDSIDSTPRDQRLILGHTLAVTQSDFKKIQSLLTEAINKASALNESEKPKDSVYHISLAAFPLTKKGD